MNATSCPGRDQLLAYHRGEMDEDAAQQLTEHLGVCAQCQETLHGLPATEDTLIARLRCPRQPDPFEREPERLQLIQRVKAMDVGGIDETVGAGSPSTSADECADKMAAAELGEYQLHEKLGQGGMGTVYRAIHTRLKRTVAVKLLPQDRTGDSRALARFEREMEAVGSLSHPNIVQAHDAREIDGTYFLVMEYVEGRDLSQLVRGLGPLPVADACEIARQAAQGLQYAHANRLVHRDIKPSNLMLSRSGLVKILDLGLARLQEDRPSREEVTTAGQVMGTAEYMAPEQVLDSHSAGAVADQYSLGCTLYKLLTGEPPFPGSDYKTPFQTMMAHVQQPVPSMTASRPDVPQPLAGIVGRMLAKTPEERFAGMAEVAAALEPFVAGSDLLQLVGDSGSAPTPTSTEFKRGSTDQFQSSAQVSTRPSVKVSPQVSSRRGSVNRWPPRTIALAIAPLFVLLLLGVVIYFKGMRFEVQDGSQVVISDDDRVEITSYKDPTEKNSQGAQRPLLVSEYDPAHERKMAEWVFSQGGRLTVSLDPLADDEGVVTTGFSAPSGGNVGRGPMWNFWNPVSFVFSDRTRLRLADVCYSLDEVPKEDFHVVAVYIPTVSQMSDEDFRNLARLPSLRVLGLSQWHGSWKFPRDLDVGGLGHLRTLRHLQALDLTGALLDDNIVKRLVEFVDTGKLKILGLARTPITDDSLRSVAKIRSLRNLDLTSTKITDAGIRHLGALASLESLCLRLTATTESPLRSLAAIDLKYLDIGRTQVVGAELDALSTFGNLTELNLSCDGLVDDDLQHLSHLRKLRLLDLDGSRITGSGLRHLHGLSELKVLGLCCPPLENDGLRYLKDLPVEDLVLSGTKVTGEGMQHVAEMRTLRNLHLGGIELDDAALQHLANLPRLESLWSVGGSYTESGLMELKKLGRLARLEFSAANLSPDAIARVIAALPGCQFFGSANPGAPGVSEALEALKSAERATGSSDSPSTPAP